MIREALALIQETTRKADAAEFVDIPGDGRSCYVQLGGQITQFTVDPPCRHHLVHTLDDLIAAAELAAGDAPLTIWHGLSEVVLILDDRDRRDRVTLKLQFSRAYQTLHALDTEPRPLDQKTFVRTLRFDLGVDKADVAPWRRLEWKSTGSAVGEVEKGRDRMGRDIAAEAQGIQELPDSLLVQIPVYDQKGCRDAYPIRCDIEIDAPAQRIIFRPVPGEMQVLMDMAQASIHEALQSVENAKVFFGSP